jgi:hypothetical protein
MRSVGTADDFILGRQPISNMASSKIILSSVNHESSTQIYFIEGTTRGMDNGYDAASYSGNSSEFSIFSNLVEENTGLDMAIQTLPYNDFNSISIPLSVNAEAGIELTLDLDSNSSLPINIQVYLEDTVENTLTLLNDDNYTFSSTESLNGTGRFYLRYSSEVLSVNTSDWNRLQIYNTNSLKEILIKGQLAPKTEANLYDIQGRLVMSYTLDTSSNSNTIEVSNLGTGIYIIKVFNNSQMKTQKVIIK